MSKHDFMNSQTHVLGVNIGCKCNGCARKVKNLLQKTNGVYATSIDMEQGKVTVTGNVDPDVLIKKLEKSGKHAEIWGSQKGLSVFNTKNTGQFDAVSNLQMSTNDKKPPEHKGEKDPQKDGGGGGNQRKQIAIQQLIQEMKASNDSKPQPVKLKDDDEIYVDGEDSDDGDGGEQPQDYKKAVHVVVNGQGKAAVRDNTGGGGGGGGGKGMKAGGGKGMMSRIGKAIGGKSEGKYGNLGKKNGGGGGEGKIGNKGGGGGFPDFEVINRHDAGKLPAVQGVAAPQMVSVNAGNGPGGVGPMDLMSGPYQQPQYMAVGNQQGMMNGGDMHPPPMYGRPMSGYGYGYAPPMPPPVHHDPVSNMFSDENPESCSTM